MTKIDYSSLSKKAMLEYISETPKVMRETIEKSEVEFAELFKALLNREIKQIVIIGSGTSSHAGLSTRSFIEKILNIPVEVYYPVLFTNWKSTLSKETLVIGISQGGESKSTINGLDFARSFGALTVSLTEDGCKSKLSAHSDICIKLHCGPELAGPKTKGYQVTMLTLFLLALYWARNLNIITEAVKSDYLSRLEKTIDNIDAIINKSEVWYQKNKVDLVKSRRMIIIGYDNQYGNVLEGRLKIEEAVRYGIEGYELEEFYHGIYHSIDEDVFILYLANNSRYKDRLISLSNFLNNYTKFNYMIGNFSDNDSRNLDFNFVDDEYFSVFEYIVPLQILAYYCSKDLGINANIPKIENFHYLMGSK